MCQWVHKWWGIYPEMQNTIQVTAPCELTWFTLTIIYGKEDSNKCTKERTMTKFVILQTATIF